LTINNKLQMSRDWFSWILKKILKINITSYKQSLLSKALWFICTCNNSALDPQTDVAHMRTAWGCSRIPNAGKLAIILENCLIIWANYAATFTFKWGSVYVAIVHVRGKQRCITQDAFGRQEDLPLILWSYPKWGSCKWAKNVLPLGKYHTIPNLFWAKVKVVLDFGVLFQVNYLKY